jgi:GGDEF domain-containing protein
MPDIVSGQIDVFPIVAQPSLQYPVNLLSSRVIDDLILTVEPNIGIAVYPENGTSGAELVSNADAAMYAAMYRTKETKNWACLF